MHWLGFTLKAQSTFTESVVFAPRAIVLNAAPNSIVSENEISSSNIFAIRIQGGSNYTVAIKNQISLSYRTFVVDTSFWVNITYNRYCNNMFSSTERIGVLSTEIYENWNSFCLESTKLQPEICLIQAIRKTKYTEENMNCNGLRTSKRTHWHLCSNGESIF